MPDPWGRRIRRADELATSGTPVASFLGFYSRLLASQKYVYDALAQQSSALTGALIRDVDRLAGLSRPLLEEVASSGPDELSHQAREWIASPLSAISELLLTYWTAPSDREFFAKAILQPYAEWLVDCGVAPQERGLRQAETSCPFCGGAPQVSVLDLTEHEAGAQDGGRQLMCATCFTTWPFRRVRCASCGQEDEHTLSYFQTRELDHLRVDVCDVCRRYIKAVDLTRLGRAVPVVDEILGAPLDLWACEHGYAKIELNLIGL